jgi:hypothetical protein
MKSAFKFSSVDNISHNIHLFDDHLFAIKTQAEDMNQMSQLTMFQQNLRGGNNGEPNSMSALFGALGGVSAGGAGIPGHGSKSGGPPNVPQNMGPFDFVPYLDLLYRRKILLGYLETFNLMINFLLNSLGWDQCVGRPEDDFDENHDNNN